jgi:hypothetical protein
MGLKYSDLSMLERMKLMEKSSEYYASRMRYVTYEINQLERKLDRLSDLYDLKLSMERGKE